MRPTSLQAPGAHQSSYLMNTLQVLLFPESRPKHKPVVPWCMVGGICGGTFTTPIHRPLYSDNPRRPTPPLSRNTPTPRSADELTISRSPTRSHAAPVDQRSSDYLPSHNTPTHRNTQPSAALPPTIHYPPRNTHSQQPHQTPTPPIRQDPSPIPGHTGDGEAPAEHH
jgi:hypothetical protein